MYIHRKLSIILLVIFIGPLGGVGLEFLVEFQANSISQIKTDGLSELSTLLSFNDLTKELLITPDNSLDNMYNEWKNVYIKTKQSLNNYLRSNKLKNLLYGSDYEEELEIIKQDWSISESKLQSVNNAIESYGLEFGLSGKKGLLLEINPSTNDYVEDIYELIVDGSNHFSKVFIADFRNFTNYVEEIVNERNNLIWYISKITSGILLLSVLFIAFIFVRSINTRLNITNIERKKIIDGEISEHPEINESDEIGILLNDFNEFALNIKFKLDTTLDYLQKVGSAMTDSLNIREIIQLIVDSASVNTKADGCVLLLVDEENPNNLKVEGYAGYYPPIWNISDNLKTKKREHIISYMKNTPIKKGQYIIGKAVSGNMPVFIKNTKNNVEVDVMNREKGSVQYISSLIAIPLVISERVIGAISVVRTSEDSYFSELDFNNIHSFADYASWTIDNLVRYIQLMEKYQLEKEVGIAAQIQNRLLPKELPKLKNAEVKAFNNPLKGVSGDYYDIIKLDEDKVAIIMCDVAGKGVPAALIMIMINTIIKLTSSPERGASLMLNWLNKGLSGKVGEGNFATIGYIIFNQKTRELLYSNASHIPIILYREKQKKYFYVDAEGLPIGVDVNAKYQQKRFALNKGDVIVLYTDGISEAMNKDGDQYETESIIRVMRKCISLPANEILDKIKEDLNGFVEGATRHDDQTLLVIKGV